MLITLFGRCHCQNICNINKLLKICPVESGKSFSRSIESLCWRYAVSGKLVSIEIDFVECNSVRSVAVRLSFVGSFNKQEEFMID